MKRAGAIEAFKSRAIALATVAMLGAMTAQALAADSAPGTPALRQARDSWDRRGFDTAETLYREALERGGLAPNEVLEGYVRLGSIRAMHKKNESAIAAFRAASVLNADFAVPNEAGSKAASLAEKAKRDTAKIGSIQLAVQVPKETSPGKAFKVTATLDKSHVAIVNRIGLSAKDGTTGKEITLDAKPDEAVEFEIGSDVTLPGASILVHIDALDGHQNRLASAEERVKVPDKETDKPVVAGAAARPTPKETSSGSSSGLSASTSTSKPSGGDTGVRRGGSFWSTPWPYVIGGVVLAGAGAAVFFGTQKTPQVSVGPVGVREN